MRGSIETGERPSVVAISCCGRKQSSSGYRVASGTNGFDVKYRAAWFGARSPTAWPNPSVASVRQDGRRFADAWRGRDGGTEDEALVAPLLGELPGVSPPGPGTTVRRYAPERTPGRTPAIFYVVYRWFEIVVQ